MTTIGFLSWALVLLGMGVASYVRVLRRLLYLTSLNRDPAAEARARVNTRARFLPRHRALIAEKHRLIERWQAPAPTESDPDSVPWRHLDTELDRLESEMDRQLEQLSVNAETEEAARFRRWRRAQCTDVAIGVSCILLLLALSVTVLAS